MRVYVGKSSKITKHLTRAAHVLIELSQNIAKHGSGMEYGNNGLLMMGEMNRKTVVYAGNVIGLSEKIILEEKLSYLSALEPEDLIELHRKTMRASLHFENKNKSGLGLIEIVKAATEPITYHFYSLDSLPFLFSG